MTSQSDETEQRVVAALDVGAVRNIGWWRLDGGAGSGGADLNDLCTSLERDLSAGRSVAIGFEAPLWIPRARTIDVLGRARRGDGNRAWSAGAGPTVLATGLQQVTYVLDQLRATNVQVSVGLDPVQWLNGEFQLLLWEAFVSSTGKDQHADSPHVSDARAAVEAFCRRIAEPVPTSDCEPDQVISLLGAALLVSGTTDDPAVLHEAAFVVKVESVP